MIFAPGEERPGPRTLLELSQAISLKRIADALEVPAVAVPAGLNPLDQSSLEVWVLAAISRLNLDLNRWPRETQLEIVHAAIDAVRSWDKAGEAIKAMPL